MANPQEGQQNPEDGRAKQIEELQKQLKSLQDAQNKDDAAKHANQLKEDERALAGGKNIVKQEIAQMLSEGPRRRLAIDESVADKLGDDTRNAIYETRGENRVRTHEQIEDQAEIARVLAKVGVNDGERREVLQKKSRVPTVIIAEDGSRWRLLSNARKLLSQDHRRK